MTGWRLPILIACAAALVAGCASQPRSSGGSGGAPSPQASKGGGYYQNDGPPDDENIDLDAVPDAIPRDEPFSRYGNPDSYEALGKTYYVLDSAAGFSQTGRASWYGKQFHGRRTSSGEPYNMFKMTAAHKRLPIPSYVRVTNLDNGKQAIVRVNDRGPFHDGRIIDLSYVAARRLDVVTHGSVPVRIETVTPASLRAEQRSQASASRQQARAATPRPPQRQTRPQPPTSPTPQSNRATQTGSSPGRPIRVANRIGTADTGLYIQSGAFGERGNAQRLKARLRNAGFGKVTVVPPQGEASLYRVHLGPFEDERSRALNRQILVEQGFSARDVNR